MRLAFISCPECGKEVSDQAAACPNCGVSINKSPISYSSHRKSLAPIIIAIVILGGFGAVIGFTIRNNNIEKERIAAELSAEEERIEAERVAEEERSEAVRIAEEEQTITQEIEYKKKIADAYFSISLRYQVLEGTLDVVIYRWEEITLLYKNGEFMEFLDSLREFEEETRKEYSNLRNPPPRYVGAYDAFTEMYKGFVLLSTLLTEEPTLTKSRYIEFSKELTDWYNNGAVVFRSEIPDIDEYLDELTGGLDWKPNRAK